jgi:hypothetical protein
LKASNEEDYASPFGNRVKTLSEESRDLHFSEEEENLSASKDQPNNHQQYKTPPNLKDGRSEEAKINGFS